ncbi:MAG: cobalamin biosynthesis protein, partial [Lachnospiraceae bacterium]|nr:cobalamin biosynthesis protein [Lachnospiraceae bacterium]
AQLLGAIPVITTSTDVNGAFSVDTFAAENRLAITDRKGIKKVSVKALEGKKVTLSIKDFPPAEKVDVIVADETDRECSLLLTPKEYTVGLGMKKNRDSRAAESFFLETLSGLGIDVSDIYALATIDAKEDEEALTYLRDRYSIPLISFDSSLLNKAEGSFAGSDFVKQTVGCDNVCERAATLAAGPGAEPVLGKTAHNGMTIAVAKRRNIWGRYI